MKTPRPAVLHTRQPPQRRQNKPGYTERLYIDKMSPPLNKQNTSFPIRQFANNQSPLFAFHVSPRFPSLPRRRLPVSLYLVFSKFLTLSQFNHHDLRLYVITQCLNQIHRTFSFKISLDRKSTRDIFLDSRETRSFRATIVSLFRF